MIVDQQEISENVKRLADEQKKLTKKMATITSEQNQIKEAIDEINTTAEQIEKLQFDQHYIIELLSSRSIQQQADIKKIK